MPDKINCNCSICKKYTPYSEKWVLISIYLANRKNRKISNSQN